MAPTSKATGNMRLPNAPLVEAVFELRWNLQGTADSPPALKVDPGFLQTQEAFGAQATKLGFSHRRDMNAPQDITAGYSISRRFYPAPEREFPILQIGPGIFATNESSEYFWPDFKKQILNGIKAVLNSYPALPNFPLQPNYLELRYVDAFNNSVVGTTDFCTFLETATHMRLQLPPFLSEKTVFAQKMSGRIAIYRDLKKWPASRLALDLGSGRQKEQDIVRLETKVVTTTDGVPKLRKPSTFLTEIGKWLEFAHGVTSPMFANLVTDKVMNKFK